MTRARMHCCMMLAAIALAGCDVFDSHLLLTTAPSDSATAPFHGPGARDSATQDLATLVDAGTLSLCDEHNRSTTCPGNYVFCDGFESESGSTFSSWTSSIVDNSGGVPANAGTAVSIAGAPVCMGQHAMHSYTVGAQQQAFADIALAARPNPFHARLFFYVAQSSKPFQLIGFYSQDGKFSWLNVDPGASQFVFANNFSSLSATFSGKAVPHNRWLCLELFAHFDATNGEVRVSLDGEQLGDFGSVNTEPSGSLQNTVNIGIVATDVAESGVNEVYIDEVAIGGNAIGCS